MQSFSRFSIMAGRVLWIRVSPFVHPSLWQFSWNWFISFFLKLCMMLGAHMEMCVTEPDIFRKILFWQKWPKMVKKWPQNSIFGLFRKICSLVLSGNGVEWKCLWPKFTYKFKYWSNFGKLIDSCSPWDYQKIYVFFWWLQGNRDWLIFLILLNWFEIKIWRRSLVIFVLRKFLLIGLN